MDWVHAELKVGLEWSEVRLSEMKKKREKLTGTEGKTMALLVGVWGGA